VDGERSAPPGCVRSSLANAALHWHTSRRIIISFQIKHRNNPLISKSYRANVPTHKGYASHWLGASALANDTHKTGAQCKYHSPSPMFFTLLLLFRNYYDCRRNITLDA